MKEEIVKKRDKYAKISYKEKKDILDEFIIFKTNPRKHLNGSIFTFNDFCYEIEANSGIKFSSVKRICLEYSKTPTIY